MSVRSKRGSAPVAAHDPVEAARRAAGDAARAEALAILKVCAEAGVPNEASGFIEKQLSVADVRQELARRSWRTVINQQNQGA